MNRKPSQNLAPVYYSLVLLLGLFLGYSLSNKSGTSFFSSNNNTTLQEISTLIKSKYVDDVNLDSITALTAESFLSNLDPHSIYIPPTDLETINNQLEGHFTGIGIMYEIIDDTLNISQVLEDGAAKKAGIEIGDKILAVNDSISLTKNKLTADFIKSKMQGKVGSSIQLTVLRDNKISKAKIQRAVVQIPSVDVGYMMDEKNGYIKINKFADRTYEEFMVQLEKLQKAKMQNLILDLRDNGGGFMHAATAIADEFLDGDKLIVYTEGKKSVKEEKRCNKDGLFETGKLIVLIDESSASASEVLAGALQDWDRATIIGRRSFGKGLVQQQYNLSNGGALRLTTARYYSPLGRNIQKPYNLGIDKYREELLNRYTDGEVFSKDSIIAKDKTFKTPKGKIVYGGGGIVPDVFVGIDTTNNLKDYYKIINSSAYNKFELNYFLAHKKDFKTAKNATELCSKIILTDADKNMLLQKFNSDTTISKVAFTNNVSNKVNTFLKAYYSKILFGKEAYFNILNKDDIMISKAIELSK